jgi:multimeric flavodoxin WrbA
MKVLGIVGSPRRNGNTEVLVNEVLAGAAEVGASTEKVILTDLNISPCNACDACRKDGNCVQEDDMAELLEKMGKAEVWVLGTPLYWWGPSAQFKIFIDRWYGAKHARFQGRRVILVLPLGGKDPNYARHLIGMMNNIFDYLGMDFFDTIVAQGLVERGAALEYPRLLLKARRVGRNAIATLSEFRSDDVQYELTQEIEPYQ